MLDTKVATLVNDLMGAAHVFATTVSDVIEEDLLREATDGQLTASQMKLLKLISLTDAKTIGDVAIFMRVSKAAASKAVDKLVRKMLVRRSPGEADRRSIHLSLTDSCRRLLACYDAARERKLEEVFSRPLLLELYNVPELLDRLSARIINRDTTPGKLCLQCGIYFRENCLLRTQLNRKCFHMSRQKGDAASTGQMDPTNPAV